MYSKNHHHHRITLAKPLPLCSPCSSPAVAAWHDSPARVQVDYDTRRVQRIVQLHLAPINTLSVYEGVCYSGADDRLLRAWPLDFSHIALEASHDAPVTAVGAPWTH